MVLPHSFYGPIGGNNHSLPFEGLYLHQKWGIWHTWYTGTSINKLYGRPNHLLVRPAYSCNITLIVLMLKALINLYVRSEY